MAAGARPGELSPEAIGSALLSAVARHRRKPAPEDDVTMIVLRTTRGPAPAVGRQEVDVYAKVFGLKPV